MRILKGLAVFCRHHRFAAAMLGLLICSLLSITGMLAWELAKPDVPVWRIETRTMDPASDPAEPKWLTTVEKIPSPTGRAKNTLRYSFPAGTLSEGIDLSKLAIQKGASAQTEIVTIKGGTNAYLKVCNLDISNYHGTEFEMTNSKIGSLAIDEVEAEGESVNITKGDVPRFACGNSAGWGQLPKDTASGRVSEVVIEVTGGGTADAVLGNIKLDDIRVPGRTLFNKLKVQDLSVTDSTFGDGDEDFTAKDFIVNANNEVRKSDVKIKGDKLIDNR